MNLYYLFLQLQQDFDKAVAQLLIEKQIPEHSIPYESLFSRVWPAVAKKIVQFGKKSRNEDIKQFFLANKDLVDSGNIFKCRLGRYTLR